jgi:hypothetical protein
LKNSKFLPENRYIQNSGRESRELRFGGKTG